MTKIHESIPKKTLFLVGYISIVYWWYNGNYDCGIVIHSYLNILNCLNSVPLSPMHCMVQCLTLLIFSNVYPIKNLFFALSYCWKQEAVIWSSSVNYCMEFGAEAEVPSFKCSMYFNSPFPCSFKYLKTSRNNRQMGVKRCTFGFHWYKFMWRELMELSSYNTIIFSWDRLIKIVEN